MITENNSYHSISPKKIIRGENAWKEGIKQIKSFCRKPLLLGRSEKTSKIRTCLLKELESIGIKTISAELKYDCCQEDLENLRRIIINNNCDSVIASGGGKVLDAGKLIAHQLSLPCITIPLSAATCAGWTALSNIYSKEGAFIKDISLEKCPDLLIFDHSFIRQAPPRTLASGIADGLAKWYEASLSSSATTDGFVQQAVQMARVLRDQLFIDGVAAFQDPTSDSWKRVIEACGLTAGLIGGIGGSRCRTAAAHPIHNGITQLNSSKKILHGELVGFGILIQLQLEESYMNNQLAKQARKQLIPFLRSLKLPLSLKDLGLDKIPTNNIKEACKFTCDENPEIHLLPFSINHEILFKTIINYELSTKNYMENPIARSLN